MCIVFDPGWNDSRHVLLAGHLLYLLRMAHLLQLQANEDYTKVLNKVLQAQVPRDLKHVLLLVVPMIV